MEGRGEEEKRGGKRERREEDGQEKGEINRKTIKKNGTRMSC